MQIVPDTIGAILALSVAASAVFFSCYATETKKKESEVKLLLSSFDAKLLNKKMRKYCSIIFMTSLAISFFWGTAIAKISPYLFGFLFLVCMISGIPILYRNGFGKFELTRFDMPRPIFARLGLALLLLFVVCLYLGGIEIGKELAAR